MYTNHVNPVALDTQDRFSNALFELMAQKPLDKIKVTELCRVSGFERMTFYRHFDSKDDIINYYLDRQMSLLLGTLPSHSTPLGNLKVLFQWVYDERVNLCLLMDSRMTNLISEALGKSVFSLLGSNINEQEYLRFLDPPYGENDTFLDYAAMGIFYGLITAWRAEGFAEPVDHVARRMLFLLGLS